MAFLSSRGEPFSGQKNCVTRSKASADLDLFREQSRGIGQDHPTLVGVNLVDVFDAD